MSQVASVEDVVAQPAEGVKARSNPVRSEASLLYAVVWRWHFYAGLITAPVLWLIIGTGAIYVFQGELAAWRDQPLLFVEPQGKRLNYEELKGIAAAAMAPHKLEAVAVFPEANRSVVFEAHEDVPSAGAGEEEHEQHRLVYLDPYTGKVLGTRVEEEDFFSIVLQLHRNLMLGSTGRFVTELVTSWGLLLMATGVYLWWPRGKKNVGVWVPQVKGKLYAVLRDWHAVTGFYLVPLGALVMFTGLFFSLVWGSGFIWSVKQAGHWAPAWFGEYDVTPPSADAPRADLDAVMATLLSHSRPRDTIKVRLEGKPNVANKVFMLQDANKNSYRMVAVDPYTAEAMAVVDGEDLPFLYRVRLWTVSIHMGQIFGMPTKILAFVTAVGLLLLSITGVWMWWVRRPQQKTGFPRRPPAGALPVWGWLVVLVSAVIFPVAGLTILLIGVLDRLLFWWRNARQPAA